MNITQLINSMLSSRWLFYKNKTDLQYKTSLISSCIGGEDIKTLDFKKVELFKRLLIDKGLKNTSINESLRILKTISIHAAKLDLIDKPPIFDMLPIGERAIKVACASDDIITRLPATLNGEIAIQVILFLYETGLRVGESLSLIHADINFIDRSFIVRNTKTSKSRILPLSDRAIDILNKMLAVEHTKICGYLESSKIFDIKYQTLYKMLKTSGYTGTIHSIRHLYCTKLVQRGANLVALQGLMGHQDIKTTMRYTHLELEDKRKAHDLLSI